MDNNELQRGINMRRALLAHAASASGDLVPREAEFFEAGYVAGVTAASASAPAPAGLLPCPFCGSAAEVYPDGDDEGHDVACSGRLGECALTTFAYASQEQANAAWNRRTSGGPLTLASASTTVAITAELVEIGELEGENGAAGLLLARGDGTFVTIKGLTRDEVRAVGSTLLYKNMALSLGAAPAPASPAPSKPE